MNGCVEEINGEPCGLPESNPIHHNARFALMHGFKPPAPVAQERPHAISDRLVQQFQRAAADVCPRCRGTGIKSDDQVEERPHAEKPEK